MRRLLFTVTTLCITLTMLGCTSSQTTEEYRFLNASFETGTLSSWTATGNAFTDSAVEIVSSDTKRLNPEGDFFLYGKRNPAQATGTLRSPTFTLKGNGKIGLLIGGGKNTDACYISLYVASSDKEVARIANDEIDLAGNKDALHRVILDGSTAIDQEVYLLLVDQDRGEDGYNYLNVDDFIVNFQGKKEQVGMQFDASRYIDKNRHLVDTRYRHSYHLMPPMGWMNDPNGFQFYQDEVHMFYQHTPYSTAWSTMYWGHATTKDLVRWQDQPVALAPDQDYDQNGCFSGSAIEKDGKLYLLYTAVPSNGMQQQALAVSDDGKTFKKLNRNPVIPTAAIPGGATLHDFRDPKVIERDGTYYAFIGSKLQGSGGQVLLYSSPSLLDQWQFVGTTVASPITGGGIFECPDFFSLSGQDVLLSSPQFLTDSRLDTYQNIHSVTYMLGDMNFSTGKFQQATDDLMMKEFDKGFDFYAAQTLTMPDGRIILMAWMNMWARNAFPSSIDGWTGAMTLPRELTLKEDHIYQQPIRELQAYRKQKVSYQAVTVEGLRQLNNVKGDTIELDVTFDVKNVLSNAGIHLLQGADEQVTLRYDALKNQLIFDRTQNGKAIGSSSDPGESDLRYLSLPEGENKLRLQIFIDKSSVEVFVNDGAYTMTGTVFPSNTQHNISFFCEEGSLTIDQLTKYDLIVK